MGVAELFDEWRNNPCGSTHARLVAQMAKMSDNLDRAGRRTTHFDDDGSDEGYYIHPELRSAMLAMQAVSM